MDTGSLIAVISAVASIIVAIFLATIVLIWQIRAQSDKIDRVENDLRAEIRAQGDRFEQRHNELRADIRDQGSRLSESEREQARLEGVNSVLLRHTHTHEPHGADD